MAGRCSCNQTCNCCMQDSNSIDVSGTGIPGFCFRPTVKYSTEAENQAQPGADGGVYVGPPCLLDRFGNPVPTNGAGCITLPLPTILDYNGDPIPPTTQGAIQLPTSGPPPSFGGGLRALPDGTLVANVGTWPTLDAQGGSLSGTDEDGAELYVDSAGQIRAPAEHTSLGVGTANDIFPAAIQPVATTFATDASLPCVIINPSPARQMSVFRTVSAFIDLITPRGGSANIDLEANYDAAGWTQLRTVSWPEIQPSGTNSIRFKGYVGQSSNGVIGPEDSHSVELRVRVTKDGAGSDDPVLVYARAACQLWGVTR